MPYKRFGLGNAAAQVQREHRQQATDEKRNTPAPRVELRRRQDRALEQQHEAERQQLTHHDRHLHETDEEPTAPRRCHFAQIRCAGAGFTAHAEALQQTGEYQDGRCGDPNGGVGGRQRNHQRTEAHHRHRQAQGEAAAEAVGQRADQPTAKRAHHVPDRRDGRRVEQLHRHVAAGEKRFAEVDREDRVREKVVPLDDVAGAAADNGAQTPRYARLIRHGVVVRIVFLWCGAHGVSPQVLRTRVFPRVFPDTTVWAGARRELSVCLPTSSPARSRCPSCLRA